MTIAVQNVAGLDGQAADFDGAIEIDYMGISVRHRDIAREYLKSDSFDLVQISHRAIGYIGDAIKRPADAGVHFPK